MADWSMSVEEHYAEYKKWLEEYKIDLDKVILHEDLTAEDKLMLEKLDTKNLVWTQHGTCENEQVSTGFSIFGDCQLTGQVSSGCGCFQSYCYYIAKVPHNSDEYIDVAAYLPCPICNADGEGEGAEDCEGPEVPEGVDGGECEGGFIQWYWD